VDATPPAFRANQSLELFESLISLYEAIEGMWRSSVVDYSFRDQMNFMRDLSRPPREPGKERTQLPPLRAWLTAALVGAAVYWTWKYLSRRKPRSPVLAATRFVDAVERQLATAGVRAGDGETLEDVSARLTREAHPLAPAVSPLTRRYLEARFGQRPLESGERARMLADLRRALDTWRQGSRPNAPLSTVTSGSPFPALLPSDGASGVGALAARVLFITPGKARSGKWRHRLPGGMGPDL